MMHTRMQKSIRKRARPFMTSISKGKLFKSVIRSGYITFVLSFSLESLAPDEIIHMWFWNGLKID